MKIKTAGFIFLVAYLCLIVFTDLDQKIVTHIIVLLISLLILVILHFTSER